MALHRANLRGRLFGRLVALRYLGPYTRSSWFCRCECGKSIVARGYELINEITKSCGCLAIELRRAAVITHGHCVGKKTSEYGIFAGIIRRCTETASDRSKDYVGRGITICDRWRYGAAGRTGFECFIEDMGRKPSSFHSIDRIDNNGNYEPENCRWATKVEQARNRRSNRRLLYRGRSITMTEATLMRGISADTISARLHKGWSIETAIETPPTRGRAKVRSHPRPGARFQENSIRNFVVNRWSPGADPEAIFEEAKERFNANRGYVKKLCNDFAERHRLVSARAAIIRAISFRSIAQLDLISSPSLAARLPLPRDSTRHLDDLKTLTLGEPAS